MLKHLGKRRGLRAPPKNTVKRKHPLYRYIVAANGTRQKPVCPKLEQKIDFDPFRMPNKKSKGTLYG
jgi:hypothetical protein